METEKTEGKFVAGIVARGSYLDEPSKGEYYMVEIMTIRADPAAVDGWIVSKAHNSREFYEEGNSGNREWEAYQAGCRKRRDAWKRKMAEAIGMQEEERRGSLSIDHVQSEVFVAVYIRRLWQEAEERMGQA